MKFVFVFLLLQSLLPISSARAEVLSGTWNFAEIIYRGVRQPRPNPDLRLRWTFNANGTDSLYWDHSDGLGFCERLAKFEVVDGLLKEEVVAVNSANAVSCGSDPDMQLGRVTANPIQIFSHEIHLSFNLGDEQVVYILQP